MVNLKINDSPNIRYENIIKDTKNSPLCEMKEINLKLQNYLAKTNSEISALKNVIDNLNIILKTLTEENLIKNKIITDLKNLVSKNLCVQINANPNNTINKDKETTNVCHTNKSKIPTFTGRQSSP